MLGRWVSCFTAAAAASKSACDMVVVDRRASERGGCGTRARAKGGFCGGGEERKATPRLSRYRERAKGRKSESSYPVLSSSSPFAQHPSNAHTHTHRETASRSSRSLRSMADDPGWMADALQSKSAAAAMVLLAPERVDTLIARLHQSLREADKVSELFEWCSWLLFGGEPSACIAQLKAAGALSLRMCSTVWGRVCCHPPGCAVAAAATHASLSRREPSPIGATRVA